MNDEELIEGRNLIEHGDFTTDWRDTWTVEGSHSVRQDSVTRKSYLQLSDGATARCSFDLPVRPDTDARYWFSFSYEGLGAATNTVTIQKDGGKVIFDESFSSRKTQENSGTADPTPLAEFRPYEPIALQELYREDVKTTLILLVTAATGGNREGINITDFKCDLRLAPLELSALSLDDRLIPLAVLPRQAVS